MTSVMMTTATIMTCTVTAMAVTMTVTDIEVTYSKTVVCARHASVAADASIMTVHICISYLG